MPIKLESLQSQIEKKDAGWRAESTTLSELSSEEQKSYLGLDVTKEEIAATENAIKAVEKMQSAVSANFAEAFSAPAAVDWRNNGGNYTTPIKDQFGCGACVSFATLATIESRMEIKCQNPNLNPNYSEAFLFYCGCGNCCGSGWNFAPALDVCKNKGVANDSDFTYTPNNQPCKPNVPIQFKIANWASVMSMTDRKNVISAKGPVVAGMAVYSDFFNYKSGVYKHVSGVLEGYHAVSVVGYNDSEKCWIAKNSWGTGWGDAGWFKIGYGQAGIDTQFAFYDVSITACHPPVQPTNCAQYLTLLKQVLVTAQSNAMLKRCLRYHVCRRPGIPPFCSQYMALINAVNKILQLCPQYRQPFCNALG